MRRNHFEWCFDTRMRGWIRAAFVAFVLVLVVGFQLWAFTNLFGDGLSGFTGSGVQVNKVGLEVLSHGSHGVRGEEERTKARVRFTYDGTVAHWMAGGSSQEGLDVFVSTFPSDIRGVAILLRSCDKSVEDWFRLPEERHWGAFLFRSGIVRVSVGLEECWDVDEVRRIASAGGKWTGFPTEDVMVGEKGLDLLVGLSRCLGDLLRELGAKGVEKSVPFAFVGYRDGADMAALATERLFAVEDGGTNLRGVETTMSTIRPKAVVQYMTDPPFSRWLRHRVGAAEQRIEGVFNGVPLPPALLYVATEEKVLQSRDVLEGIRETGQVNVEVLTRAPSGVSASVLRLRSMGILSPLEAGAIIRVLRLNRALPPDPTNSGPETLLRDPSLFRVDFRAALAKTIEKENHLDPQDGEEHDGDAAMSGSPLSQEHPDVVLREMDSQPLIWSQVPLDLKLEATLEVLSALYGLHEFSADDAPHVAIWIANKFK